MTNEVLEALVCDVHGPFAPHPDCGRRCPQCLIENSEKRGREEAMEEAKQRLDLTGVPRRFRGKSLESFRTETPAQEAVLSVVRDYVHQFPKHYAEGRCLIFCGGIGTGKTLLASCIAQSFANIEFLTRNQDNSCSGFFYRARYTTASEIIRTIRDTWATKTSTTSVIEAFAKVHLLLIDEVGANIGTDSERSLLFDVIDARYQAARPMVVISNCGREGLTYALGERVLDRLFDHGGSLCLFNWESFRK